MPYYHVYISHVPKLTGEIEKSVAYNMSEEGVKRLVAEPFMDGVPFLFLGTPIDPFRVNQINIYRTEKKLEEIEKEGTSYYNIDDVIEAILDREIGKVVTLKFIFSLPQAQKVEKWKKRAKASKKLSKKIFIAHGRNTKPVKELEAILEELGLNPVVLHEQPSGSMTIVEKLERYSEDIGFAFIILTPDDVLIPTEEYTINFSQLERISRARQNVILEFGYFIAKLGRDKVCCLYNESTELPYEMPSDMHGIVYVRFKISVNERRDKIIRELKRVGYKFKDK